MIVKYYQPTEGIHQLPESINSFPRRFDIYYYDNDQSYSVRIEMISDLNNQNKMFLIEGYFVVQKQENLEIAEFLKSQSKNIFKYLLAKHKISPEEWPHQTNPEKVPISYFENDQFEIYNKDKGQIKEFNTNE